MVTTAPGGLLLDEDEAADVVIVCVTYNSSAVLPALLDAMAAALHGVGRCRVVVVDNDSHDGTPDLVRAVAPWACVIQTGRNAGYAGAINTARRRHPARHSVLVLNPDTVPAPGSVRRLVDALDADPAVGAAIPRLVGVDDRPHYSLRREPTVLRALGEAALGGRRAARFPRLGETVRDLSRYHDGADADWATGAALLISRRASDAAGEWDERFFLYSEETDYCLRLRDAGYHLHLVADAVVVHEGGDQSISPGLWSLAAVNRTRLYRKRHGRAASALYWTAVLANESARALAGSPVHRAAVRALLAAGPDQPGPEPTPRILAHAGHPVI